jgi:hypothetical protein
VVGLLALSGLLLGIAHIRPIGPLALLVISDRGSVDRTAMG